MGKDLKGKELGVGINQQKNGLYSARYTDKFGNRRQKRFKKLQECRQWLADEIYIDEHSNLNQSHNMIVDAWFDYWIEIKKRTVRPNTVRNYTERYERNIKHVIGKLPLKEVQTIHCQKIFLDMADEDYRSTTIYQTRIALYNMLEFAKECGVIIENPCKKSVKSDIGKPTEKKEALTIDVQKKFLEGATGQSYENQYRFILQTGLRTGELVALQWKNVDFKKKTLTIEQSMEYRYSVGEWRLGPPKSKSGYRTIPLTDEAIRILKAQKRKNRRIKVIPIQWADYIFLSRKGEPVKNSAYDTALFKICDKAGIKRFSMHVLRHTFATRCIEGGMKPKILQVILGHSKLSITMDLYVHATEEEKLKELNMVAEVLNAI